MPKLYRMWLDSVASLQFMVSLETVTKPDYGASSHMARLVLSIMKHDPEKRCALNIKYIILNWVELCKKLGLKVSSYNREHEPSVSGKKRRQHHILGCGNCH
jgi:predicted fused transcriptional regulator/phosphomethylpyrimidine kinase